MSAEWREISVPAQGDRLAELIDFASRAAGEAGLAEEDLLFLQMAVEELASNVIKYAYPGGGGSVSLAWRKQPGGLFLLRLKDRGQAFNPLEARAPDTTLSLDQRVPGGLGILLTEHFMHNLEYARQGDENVITLAVRLPGGGDGAVSP